MSEQLKWFDKKRLDERETDNVALIAVYDSGTVFDPAVLDITDDDLRTRFLQVTISVPKLLNVSIYFNTCCNSCCMVHV